MLQGVSERFRGVVVCWGVLRDPTEEIFTGDIMRQARAGGPVHAAWSWGEGARCVWGKD